eukprot:11448014-Alexandrium_andersonii.AAC.1
MPPQIVCVVNSVFARALACAHSSQAFRRADSQAQGRTGAQVQRRVVGQARQGGTLLNAEVLAEPIPPMY